MQSDMVGEIGAGILCSAQHHNLCQFDHLSGRIGPLSYDRVCLIPNLLRIILCQGFCYTKISLQLQHRPVVDRIAYGEFQTFCKGIELVKGISITSH